MTQYMIVYDPTGEIIPGCNAKKRKEAIEFFEDLMGAPFIFSKQDDYKCKKYMLVKQP